VFEKKILNKKGEGFFGKGITARNKKKGEKKGKR